MIVSAGSGRPAIFVTTFGSTENTMLKMTSIVLGGLAAGMLFAANQASAQPAGSYLGSCRHVEQRGRNLYALCKDMQGGWNHTSINTASCRGPIANSDGHLVCPGGGAPAYDRRDEYRRGRDRRYDHRDHRDRREGYSGYDH